jgi:carotenoid 1,2-hydratase
MAHWPHNAHRRAKQPAVVTQTLEDTPFYVRSVLSSSLLGESVASVHETLNVPRLVSTSTCN